MTVKPVVVGTDGSAQAIRAVEWAAREAAMAVTRSACGALMLVVGSHGSGTFAAMTLGSVSRYAAVHAACPAVVVREEHTATHGLVAVGIRITEDCGAALAFAFEEARLRKAALRAVHAWQFRDSHAAEMQAAMNLDDLLNDWQSKYPDVEASQDVVHGHPGRVLADLSAAADLVVLGRHGANGRLAPGPARVVHAVVSHAHGTVVTVPMHSA